MSESHSEVLSGANPLSLPHCPAAAPARRWAHSAQATAAEERKSAQENKPLRYEGPPCLPGDYVYEQVEQSVQVIEFIEQQKRREEHDRLMATAAAQSGKSLSSLPRCKVCTFLLGSAEHARVCGPREESKSRVLRERREAAERARLEAMTPSATLDDLSSDSRFGRKGHSGKGVAARVRWRKAKTQGADWANKLMPCARTGHSMVYFPASQGAMGATDKLVLFGGLLYGIASDKDAPQPFRPFLDVVGNKVAPTYLGGAGEIHVLDLHSSTWMKHLVDGATGAGSQPCARHSHTATLVGQRMFVFGGRAAGGVLLNDVHYLDLSDFGALKWHAVDTGGMAPPRRCLHAATALSDSRILVYGGQGDTGDLLSDLWAFDCEAALATHDHTNVTLRRLAQKSIWTMPVTVGQSPPPLAGHALSLLPGGGKLILLGQAASATPGSVGGGASLAQHAEAALWQLDLATMIWCFGVTPPLKGGAPTWSSRSSLAVSGRVCLTFGGSGCLKLLDLSTHAWIDPEVIEVSGVADDSGIVGRIGSKLDTNRKQPAPLPRLGLSATVVGSRVVCFGGSLQHNDAPTDDVLLFELELLQ